MRDRWPTDSDYVLAVQNPSYCFARPELKGASVRRVDRLGLPAPISGNFACVFQIGTDSETWAIRCFKRYFADREQRYRAIAEYLATIEASWKVSFDFIEPNGIRVGSTWHPVLKMEWLESLPLTRWVEEHLGKHSELERLAGAVADVVTDLQSRGLAHGDLQHDNIRVLPNGDLRLIDYDGMYVPPLKDLSSPIAGHPNYQHPERLSRSDYFGPSIDNFSVWIIYMSLYFLAVDPSLWEVLEGGDDCLLFRKGDFDPNGTGRAFKVLDATDDDQLRRAALFVKDLALREIDGVPPLIPSTASALFPWGYTRPGVSHRATMKAVPSRARAGAQQQGSTTWTKPGSWRTASTSNRTPPPARPAPAASPPAHSTPSPAHPTVQPASQLSTGSVPLPVSSAAANAAGDVEELVHTLLIYGLPALFIYAGETILVDSKVKHLSPSAENWALFVRSAHQFAAARPWAFVVAALLVAVTVVFRSVRTTWGPRGLYSLGALASVLGIGACGAAASIGAMGGMLLDMGHLGALVGLLSVVLLLGGLFTLVAGVVGALYLAWHVLYFAFKALTT